MMSLLFLQIIKMPEMNVSLLGQMFDLITALEIEFFERYFLQLVLGRHPVLGGHLKPFPKGDHLILLLTNTILVFI